MIELIEFSSLTKKKKGFSNRVIQGESSTLLTRAGSLKLVTLLTLSRAGSSFLGTAHFAVLAVNHEPNSKDQFDITEIIQ